VRVGRDFEAVSDPDPHAAGSFASVRRVPVTLEPATRRPAARRPDIRVPVPGPPRRRSLVSTWAYTWRNLTVTVAQLGQIIMASESPAYHRVLAPVERPEPPAAEIGQQIVAHHRIIALPGQILTTVERAGPGRRPKSDDCHDGGGYANAMMGQGFCGWQLSC
jgi:hypothetical protein